MAQALLFADKPIIPTRIGAIAEVVECEYAELRKGERVTNKRTYLRVTLGIILSMHAKATSALEGLQPGVKLGRSDGAPYD